MLSFSFRVGEQWRDSRRASERAIEGGTVRWRETSSNGVLHKLTPLFQERRKTLRKRLDIYLPSGFCRRYGKKILKSTFNQTIQDFVTYSKCKLNAKSTVFSIDEGLRGLVNRWGALERIGS